MAFLFYFQEPETLSECVSSISRMQFIVCCSGFFEHGGRFFINKWTRIYSLSCAFLAVLGLSSTVYALLQNELVRQRLLRLDNLVLSIMGLELVISTIVFMITVLSLQAWAKQHLCIYKRIAEVDKQLVRDFGVRLNYGKLMRKNVVVLALVSILYLGAVNTALARLAEGRHLGLVVSGALCYIVITSGPHLTGYAHIILTELLSIRFRLLRRILKPELLQKQFGKDELMDKRLRSLVNMIKELHYIIQQINEVFGLSLWSAMVHDFTLSTSELYIIFGRSVGNSDINITARSSFDNKDSDDKMGNMMRSFLSLCMLVPFYKMLMGPAYCNHSVNEGRKCLQLLEHLDTWFPGRTSIKQLVESMMRWRLQFKIEFTSGTSTALNKSVITLYTSIVFNYLLVLISFANTQKLGEQVEQQINALQDWIGMK